MARPRTSRSTIGNDPFATVIPTLTEFEPVQEMVVETETPVVTSPVRTRRPKAENRDRPEPPSSQAVVGKQKLTIHLEANLVNRVKNAAYWNPRLTIAKIAESGIRQSLDKVEKENGGQYPERESELVGGRPIK